jgi:16S rRNA (guanine1516-N2)-methyltransferase
MSDMVAPVREEACIIAESAPALRAFVTVSANGRAREVERARALAGRIGLAFELHPPAGHRRLVVERSGVRLETEGGVVRSHPGMGLVRLRRLMRETEPDPLLEMAGVRSGDHVVDATFGFGQDALVLAFAVGSSGRVTALEASPLLAGLALEGMHRWPEPGGEVTRRIDLQRASAREWLRAAATASADVVYFDPMFRKPKASAPDFAVLRLVAETSPLDGEMLREAQRVARRLVVVKDAWPGHELVRLGREPVDRDRRADIVFATWPSDSCATSSGP